MAKPWWQHFAVSEDTAYILSKDERLITFLIIILCILIITPLFVYNLFHLWNQPSYSGSTIVKDYTYMIVGVYMMFLNSFLLRVSIYFTDGEYSVFAQEKAVLYLFGIFVYIKGAVNVSLGIVNFRKKTIRNIKLIYYIFISLAISVITTQFLVIFENQDIVEITLALQSVASMCGVLFLLMFIVSFLFEITNNPSKIEILRLKLLSFSLLMMLIELFFVGFTSIAKRIDDPGLFLSLSTYAIPLTYLITVPIMYLLFQWSIFTPNWLLIRAKVIQPSFREFLQKTR
ncbi:MAG: hypothetical protein ACXAD7_05250 [Candidatus Kariarchaeaceae archaeon]|jgi:hypothetical protein